MTSQHREYPAATTPAGAAANGTSPAPARRLVAAAYRSEQEAADKVLRLGPGIDACLFASQVPYEYARRAGALRVPATYVPLSRSALYAAPTSSTSKQTCAAPTREFNAERSAG